MYTIYSTDIHYVLFLYYIMYIMIYIDICIQCISVYDINELGGHAPSGTISTISMAQTVMITKQKRKDQAKVFKQVAIMITNFLARGYQKIQVIYHMYMYM